MDKFLIAPRVGGGKDGRENVTALEGEWKGGENVTTHENDRERDALTRSKAARGMTVLFLLSRHKRTS